jgi:hypothetical protein
MDIVWAEHNGRSLCWNSSTGVVHPAFYEEGNFGWLRGFGGGLLTTCGLSSFGPACEDEGEFYGIHDRASYLPASNVQTGETWHGDECEIWCSAQVRQTRVFGPNLLLTRRITTHLGSNKTLSARPHRERGLRAGARWLCFITATSAFPLFPSTRRCARRQPNAHRATKRHKSVPTNGCNWIRHSRATRKRCTFTT